MLEKIKEPLTRQEEIIKYLSESKLPLVVYGAGFCAKKALELLHENGIKPNHICVDKAYFTPDTFFEGYKIEAYEDLKHNTPDNCRGQYNTILAVNSIELYKKLKNDKAVKNVFVFDVHRIWNNYYAELQTYKDELETFYSKLQDEKSREILIEFINAKLTGNIKPLLELTDDAQYFDSVIQLSDNEIFVDCGAYDGDTIKEFTERTKEKYDKIFAFEPDSKNIEKLQSYEFENSKIEVIKKGAWSEQTTLSFVNEGSIASKIDEQGETKIQVDCIDNVLKGEKATFIKMDIEGSELEALKGAKNTIKNYAPKLAVCVYHKSEDLYAIPTYISSLNPNYRFYLRKYGFFTDELVLYAIE